MPRQQSFAVQIKKQVSALLKKVYPESAFSLSSKSWSTGGAVDILWTDGPSLEAVQGVLKPIKAQTSISICADRRYSEAFLKHVANEYCRCAGCELPDLDVHSDGSAWLNWKTESDLKKNIMKECNKLAQSDLKTLIYRRCITPDGKMIPDRAWIVRKKDFSRGKDPDWAKVLFEGSLWDTPVRRRINADWVEVRDGI